MSELNSSYLPIAIQAAVEAGLKILEVYDGDHKIEYKKDNSPLTIADQKSHNKIIEYLTRTNLPVLSEEGKAIPYNDRSKWDLFWMVDPLDGTKEFIKKNGEFTVNIALIKEGTPVLGVIYLPVGDKLYFASADVGSYSLQNAADFIKNNSTENKFTNHIISESQKLPSLPNNKPFTVVASRSHLSTETEALVSNYKSEHGELAFISKGSSIKICLVAEGAAHVYPRLAPTMEWDTAAGQAIAINAGCTFVEHPSGNTVQYNKENLLNPFFIVQRSS